MVASNIPGEFDDRGLDGAILVEPSDISDENHRNEDGKTLTEHIATRFGIDAIYSMHVVMVRLKKAHLTHHI